MRAETQLNIYLFHRETCPHCAKERAYLEDEFAPKYPQVQINMYEVYYNKDNLKLWQQVLDVLGVDINKTGVPFLVIGDQEKVGFGETTMPTEIENRVNYCLEHGCPDPVASIINPGQSVEQNDQEGNNTTSDQKDNNQTAGDNDDNADRNTEQKIVSLPLIGEIDAYNYSLPLLTVFLGVVDGFNPCAMWTLLFLISLLLGFENRKKMWLLGGTFIFTSALVYFLFMAAWLNVFLVIGYKRWLNLLIAIVALAGGIYGIRSYLKNKNGGCEVTGSEKRQATFEKLKKIVNHNNLWFALGGIVLLAFVVNLVELLCSTGFPAVYTKALTLNDLPIWQYYGYLLLYVFFFMLDDLIIFFIAMTTLRLTGISTKYGRISKLVGGVLMIMIGLLLAFKPEWLMFG